MGVLLRVPWALSSVLDTFAGHFANTYFVTSDGDGILILKKKTFVLHFANTYFVTSDGDGILILVKKTFVLRIVEIQECTYANCGKVHLHRYIGMRCQIV